MLIMVGERVERDTDGFRAKRIRYSDEEIIMIGRRRNLSRARVR